MHYTVRFTGTREQKVQQARKEVREYVGRGYANVIHGLATAVRLMQADKDRKAVIYRSIRVACAFGGIRGRYPVRAVVEDVIKQVQR